VEIVVKVAKIRTISFLFILNLFWTRFIIIAIISKFPYPFGSQVNPEFLIAPSPLIEKTKILAKDISSLEPKLGIK
jgi:hypothetical protein